MYCSQCGNELQKSAKFCDSCGAPVKSQSQYQEDYTAPKPFQQNSIDGRSPQYQKAGFKGVQKTVGTSGSIGFGTGYGEKRKRGFFGKIIRLGVVVAVIAALIVIVPAFLSSEPIDNIESGTGIDLVLQELTGKTTTFSTSEPEIYLLFEHNDIPIGSQVEINLFYGDEEFAMDSYLLDIEVDEGLGYVAFIRPGAAWTVGEYYIEFVDDGELLNTYTFTVE